MFTHLHRSKQSLFYALLFYYYGHFNGETHQPKNPEKTLHQSEKTICMSQSVKK